MEVWTDLNKIWSLPVWTIDKYPVTLGKLISAILLCVIGFILTRFFIRALSRYVRPHLKFRESTIDVIFKSLRYGLYALLLALALDIVDIPLTAFAFLGGALAIGVGFGAQQLINNFISGFILMAERPIQIGDLVEVERVIGRVEEIGARCTQIRTGENTHILVPNSKFLESSISNWTFNDRTLRTKVTVGVIYGSPVDKVRDILIQAAEENKRVLNIDPPMVLFHDFGDNALIFDVYFWINVNYNLERKIIESEVRFRIDELCREAGVVIAFPQRDTHLDAKDPLPIRLVQDQPPGSNGPKPSSES